MPMPAVDALPAELDLLLPQCVIVHHPDELLQALVERHGLEPLSSRRDARQRRLRAIIATLELDGVDAERGGGKVGQQLRDHAGQRHADPAVHADQVLVDVDAARAGLVILEPIGRARHRDRHHPFGDAEPHRHAIGADRADVVHLHGGDLAAVLERDARLDPVVAGLRIGNERFEPVDAELHRPAQQHAGGNHRHLVGIEVELHPEATADIRRDHPHLVLGYLEMAAEYVLHLEWRLVRMDDRERPVAAIEVGNEASRLQRQRQLPLEPQLFLDDQIGLGEGLGGLALLHREIERQVVAQLGVDRGCGRIERLLLVGDRNQLVPFDGDQLRRVLGLRPALGNDGYDRLALPDRFLLGQQRLRRGAVTGPVQRNADEGLAHRVELGRGKHGDDTRCDPSRFDFDGAQRGVRVRAAHEAGVQHARQLDVVEIAALPAQQPRELDSGNSRPDPGVLRRDAHGLRPLSRARARCPRSPLPRHRRWRDSRCTGTCFRTALAGFPRAMPRRPATPAHRPSAACRTSRTRIARHFAR